MGVLTGLAWLWGGNVEGFPKSAWEAAGVVSAGQLDEWLALNVRRPGQVEEWRACSVRSPSEARFWVVLGQGPKDAAAWMRVCDPLEARDWITIGYRPADAQKWRGYGVAPHEIPSWKQLGVETGTGIVGWVTAGFKPDVARPWIRAGILDPIEASLWRDASASPKVRAAWLKAGFSSEDALRLVIKGVDRREASKMREVGAQVDEIPGWVDSREGQRGARRWIEAGLTPHEYTAWSQRGGWKAFRRWAGDWSSIVDLRGHTEGWADVGMSPQEAITWLPITSDPSVAADWRARGVSTADAKQWCDAGFLVPSTAEFWLNEGRTPDWVKAWEAAAGADSAGWYSLTHGDKDAVGAWRAAGAQSARDATSFVAALAQSTPGWDPLAAYKELRAVHAVPLSSARDWVASFSLPTALEWLRAGIDSPSDASAWVKAGFSAAEARRWRLIDVDPSVCDAWRAAVGDPDEATQWWRAGVSSADDASTLRSLQVDPSEAAVWIRLGATSAGSLLRWRTRWDSPVAADWTSRLGADLETAWDWRDVAERDLEAATRLLNAGLSPDSARDWLSHGFSPEEIVEWRNAGCDSTDLASRLAASGVTTGEALAWTKLGAKVDAVLDRRSKMPIDEAQRWVEAVGSLDSALHWQSLTTREVAAEFVAGGVAEPEDGRRWMALEFSTGDAVSWHRTGLDAAAAAQWVAVGLTQMHAATWARLTTDAKKASEWIAVCPDAPKEAETWDKTGVTPTRVVELRAIGLTADSHATLFRASRKSGDYAARLRVQAARHNGFDVAEDGTLVMDVGDTPSDVIPRRLRCAIAAAAAAGERTVRVRHGFPRLSPESVRQLPEARFVRGAAKAAVLHYGWALSESQFHLAGDGSHSEFTVEASASPCEFIHVDFEVDS